MTTKVLVTQLTVAPSVATQGQFLSLQVGANNTIIATVTAASVSDEVDSFLLAGM